LRHACSALKRFLTMVKHNRFNLHKKSPIELYRINLSRQFELISSAALLLLSCDSLAEYSPDDLHDSTLFFLLTAFPFCNGDGTSPPRRPRSSRSSGQFHQPGVRSISSRQLSGRYPTIYAHPSAHHRPSSSRKGWTMLTASRIGEGP
jgi:hypothetical protein